MYQSQMILANNDGFAATFTAAKKAAILICRRNGGANDISWSFEFRDKSILIAFNDSGVKKIVEYC